jgi:hypothetical protein
MCPLFALKAHPTPPLAPLMVTFVWRLQQNIVPCSLIVTVYCPARGTAAVSRAPGCVTKGKVERCHQTS